MGKLLARKKVRLTASKVIHKLWETFGKSCEIATPNGYIYPWECDLLMVSKTGYTTEYEVKLSVQDFKRDSKKVCTVSNRDYSRVSKFDAMLGGKGANRFFYVFPVGMIDHSLVPEWAGIIHINSYKWGEQDQWEYLSTSLIRKPKWLHKQKADESIIQKIQTCLYYKVFNRMKKTN